MVILTRFRVIQTYYDVYMNGPVYAETDDEAEPYVDEVVKIAANNGAQIQF